jgi:hypothetical protein
MNQDEKLRIGDKLKHIHFNIKYTIIEIDIPSQIIHGNYCMIESYNSLFKKRTNDPLYPRDLVYYKLIMRKIT